MAERLLFEVLVIVVASFAVVTALVRLLSPVTGYLLTGVLIGPQGWSSCRPRRASASLASWASSPHVYYRAGLLPAALLAAGSGFRPGPAVAPTLAGGSWHVTRFGGRVLMRGRCHVSTAIAQAALGSGGLNTQHGRLLGILLFQDLATLPFLISRTP